MTTNMKWLVLVFLLLGLVMACTSIQKESRLPVSHPVEADIGQQPPICVDCHEPRGDTLVLDQFNHTATFGDQHKRPAYQHEQVCSMCHQRSFCNDCHATRLELKPSLKDQSDTFRQMPHRGDYLARHRIDGRVDPTSCFRCHGNPRTAETCVKCHG